MEIIIPKTVTFRSGTNMNQTSDESKSEQSHTNAAATKMMIRIGSCAMVMVNMARAGPKARKAQPKNSGKVMLKCSFFYYHRKELIMMTNLFVQLGINNKLPTQFNFRVTKFRAKSECS